MVAGPFGKVALLAYIFFMTSAPFQALIDDLNSKGWHSSDSLVPPPLCEKLLRQLVKHRANHQLRKAAIGSGSQKQVEAEIRGDFIFWLDEKAPTALETNFFLWLSQLIKILDRQLMMGLCEAELHYAFYPPQTQYQKHRDVFKTKSDRKLSFVLYLNKDWGPEDGGELILFDEQNPELETARIAPQFGRLVVFLSENIYHQVNLTNRERFSVTGWLKNQL